LEINKKTKKKKKPHQKNGVGWFKCSTFYHLHMHTQIMGASTNYKSSNKGSSKRTIEGSWGGQLVANVRNKQQATK
jgi:hypothetical protein